MLALAIGAELLQESQRIVAGSVRSLTQRSEETAWLRLASDLRSLDPPGELSSTCNPLPLELTDGARRVAWSLESGRLVRRTEVAGSAVATPMLADLIGFCWRQELAGWIEVSLTRRAPERALAWRLASAQWKRRDERTEALSIGVAPRRGWR